MKEHIDVEEYLINFYKKKFEKAECSKGKELTVKNIFKCLNLYKLIFDSYDIKDCPGWTTEKCVIKVGDKYIGFKYAYTLGGKSPEDKGWEWDGQIWFVEQVETIVTTWEEVK